MENLNEDVNMIIINRITFVMSSYHSRKIICTDSNHLTLTFLFLDMVKISMETFVRRFQPEKYENWLEGKDYGEHPEEPGKITLAPKPILNKKLMM